MRDYVLSPTVSSSSSPTAWYAIWTRSNAEQLVADQLDSRGFHTFLPKVLTWTRRGQARRRVEQPLFPGYLFVCHPIDRTSHVEILSARGVVRLLGDGTSTLAAIPHGEIDAVRRMLDTGAPIFRDKALADGDRVRIIGGPLQGLEGWFRRARPDKGLFLISVALLHRTVSLEIDGTLVEAA